MRSALIQSVPKFFNNLRAQLRMLFQLVRTTQKSAPLPGPDFIRTFRRALKLHREDLYTPEEAYELGILDPERSGKSLRDSISKNRMREIQRSLNPGSWTRVLEDKSIFYKYCIALDVPTPDLHACFFKGRAGWSRSGSALRNRDDWVEFLRTELPEAFVIKPAWGVYGLGVRIFSRHNTAELFTDATGVQLTPEEIYDTVLLDPRYQCMVIQARLMNHPELVRLSDTEYLQTVRILTFVDGSNNCRIVHASFKPIVGRNFVDNHDHGRTGNLNSIVVLETGKLTATIRMTADGSGEKVVDTHPVTNRLFEGFEMPLWEETCQLAVETAYKFLPLRLVGWDVAVAPSGPFIVEGNAWSDPRAFEGAREIMESLQIA